MNTQPTSILACDRGGIYPDHYAGDRRWGAMLQAISREFELTYFSFKPEFTANELVNALGQSAASRLNHIPLDWRPVERMLSVRQYDIALLEFWLTAEMLRSEIRRRQPGTKIIVDTVDVHFTREQSAAQLGLFDPATAEKNKQAELAAYQEADAVIVITEYDRQTLLDAGLATPMHVIPLIIPTRPRPSMKRESTVLFVGGFGHKPNGDGISWFVRECWARVRSAVSEAALCIVGSNPTPEIMALNDIPGIRVVGFVPDCGPYLDAAAVSIAPLRFGSGMKGKVCDALASGLPVVTTPVGAQGIPLVDGQSARIAESAEDFANAVAWALQNPDDAEAMGLAGQSLISQICGPTVVEQRIARMLQAVSQSSGRPATRIWRWRVWSNGFRAMASARTMLRTSGILRLWNLLRRK